MCEDPSHGHLSAAVVVMKDWTLIDSVEQLADSYRHFVEDEKDDIAPALMLLGGSLGGVLVATFYPVGSMQDCVRQLVAELKRMGPFSRIVVQSESWIRSRPAGVDDVENESLIEAAVTTTLSAEDLCEMVVQPFVRTRDGVRWLKRGEVPDIGNVSSMAESALLEVMRTAVTQ